MNKQSPLKPEKHREQINAYVNLRDRYKTFAEVLRRVLEQACAVSIPEAFVQTRAKTVSSFAEKAARKHDKYPDAVNQMTDLCGARVIVQTLEQVEAVKLFIEANFEIDERDEKGVLLGEDKFGYRDMHYITRLKPDRCEALGITAEDRERIGGLKAEIQVRTWLQHAWADTLHDRIYKTPLKLPAEIKRTGNLLAALMEEGDRNYNHMAHELDGMIANYTTFALRDQVEREIAVQELILRNESDEGKKPGLALKLGRLLAASGDFAGVVKVLEPHQDIRDANRRELLQDLGHALCRVHRGRPAEPEYLQGLDLLRESLELCRGEEIPFVPHLRRREGLHARVLGRLGRALEVVSGEEHQAREYHQQAHEHESANPYYFADMLGFEIYCSRKTDLPDAMRTTIREALKTCRAHAAAGIQLPYAFFTAGRMSLLLKQPYQALGYYARGIRHCLAGKHCFPAGLIEEEMEWLKRIYFGDEPPAEYRWARKFLSMAEEGEKGPLSPDASPSILFISGGAASIDSKTLTRFRPLVETALSFFKGKVISGGTMSGVPGCVGEIAAQLSAQKEKGFELIGYICENLPHDAPRDDRYDRRVVCGKGTFSPVQLLRAWSDLFAAGVRPHQVLVLGFGGGPLSAAEYHLALALGASVAVAVGSGGAADALLEDDIWAGTPNLYPMPADAATLRALFVPPRREYAEEVLEDMARNFHANFVSEKSGDLPSNMHPWENLPKSFKKASREQARYAVEILEACGFDIRPVAAPKHPVVFDYHDFTDQEVHRMAEMEHGRWNVERLRDGWRPGKQRDDKRKINVSIVPWVELPENIKKYDFDSVLKFPEILAQAGLEVRRRKEDDAKPDGKPE